MGMGIHFFRSIFYPTVCVGMVKVVRFHPLGGG